MRRQPGYKKKILVAVCGMMMLFAAGKKACRAGDFILEYVGENYKETTAPSSYSPIIYHSIQVKTQAGPKIIVLTGKDQFYRKWLRQYIAQGKQLIAQVPDDRNDQFIGSSVFEMDVTDVHPFNLSKYKQGLEKSGPDDPDQPITTQKADDGLTVKKPKDLKSKEKTSLSTDGNKAPASQKATRNKIRNPDILKKADRRAPEKAQAKKDGMQHPAPKAAGIQGREQALTREAQQEIARLEQQQVLARLTSESAVEEQLRKAALQQQWLELKARLMEEERIRRMEAEQRNAEIERRWLELQQRLQVY